MTIFRFAACVLLFGSVPALALAAAAHPGHAPPLPSSAQAPAATVDAFHAALRRGDTAAAAALLAEDVLVFESGGVERDKAEYAAGHLQADAEFARAVATRVTRRTGAAAGNVAWIGSEGTTKGTFRGKAVDRLTTETMVLRRVGGTWKIAHIHWSSAVAPAAAAPTAAATGQPLLARSVPANGQSVAAPVDRVELHFSPPARLLEVVIGAPDGQIPMMVTAAGEQSRYVLPAPALGPGTYSVDWRASAAGREDRGTFRFTVR